MKKKSNIKGESIVKILGIKLTTNNLAGIIICLVIAICLSVWSLYKDNKLENGNNIIVVAEIIDVSMRTQGGLGYRNSYPELKCRYFFENKEYYKHFRITKVQYNNIQIGDCIEIKLSTENEHIYEWNKTKGTFKCQ